MIKNYRHVSDVVKYYDAQSGFKAAWEKCDDAAWMLRVARQLGVPTFVLRAAKIAIAQKVRAIAKSKTVNAVLDAALTGRRRKRITERKVKTA
jgi:hypothetical protein